MPLINCKVELSLRWIDNYVLTTTAIGADGNTNGADSATFKITDTKLYVPGIILSTEGSAKLAKQLSEGFKRPVYQNKCKTIDKKSCNTNTTIRELLDSSYQGVKRLFALACNNTDGDANRVDADSLKKSFFPRVKIENYSIEIDGRNFYDQPINDSIKQKEEVRKVSPGQGDDYTSGCLLGFAYCEKKIPINCS